LSNHKPLITQPLASSDRYRTIQLLSIARNLGAGQDGPRCRGEELDLEEILERPPVEAAI